MQDNRQGIPNLSFKKPSESQIEFQILSINELFHRGINKSLETPHRLDFNAIIIMDNEGIHNIDFTPYPYTKGTVFFIARHQIHSFVVTPNSSGYLLFFTDTFLNRLIQNNIHDLFDYMRFPVKLQLTDHASSIYQNLSLLVEEMEAPLDYVKEPILLSLLQSLLLKLKRQRDTQAIVLSSKDQLIYQNFKNLVYKHHSYTKHVNDYAKTLKISTKTLTNLLHKYTGKSTKMYLDDFLLLHIKRFLLDESLTLQNIADKLDFDEATNLVKFFKRTEGTTPSHFKEKNRIV